MSEVNIRPTGYPVPSGDLVAADHTTIDGDGSVDNPLRVIGGGGGGSFPTLTITGEVVTEDLDGSIYTDFNPTGFDGLASILLVTNSNPNSVIAGLKAQAPGRIVIIIAPLSNSDRFLIDSENGSTDPENQFQLPEAEGWYLEPGSAAIVRYDGGLEKWLAVGFWSAGMASLHVLGASRMEAGLTIIQNGLTVSGPDGFAHISQEGDFGGGVYNRRQLIEDSVITPTAITGAQNNYAPVDAADPTKDLSACRFLRQPLGGAANLTGLLAPSIFNYGQRICIRNLSSVSNLTLNHENVGSDPANRFNLPSGASLVILPFGSAEVWYDPDSTRYVLV